MDREAEIIKLIQTRHNHFKDLLDRDKHHRLIPETRKRYEEEVKITGMILYDISTIDAIAPAADSIELKWRDGEPPKPWRNEWFIAETTFGDRVVLTALPEEYTYDYKTGDETYIKADKIVRWMQFPDSNFIAPFTPICDCEYIGRCSDDPQKADYCPLRGIAPATEGVPKEPGRYRMSVECDVTECMGSGVCDEYDGRCHMIRFHDTSICSKDINGAAFTKLTEEG